MKNNMILVQDVRVNIMNDGANDYICLTDIAKSKLGNSKADDIIKNWLRKRSILEFFRNTGKVL